MLDEMKEEYIKLEKRISFLKEVHFEVNKYGLCGNTQDRALAFEDYTSIENIIEWDVYNFYLLTIGKEI